jgi:hypothetical protein
MCTAPAYSQPHRAHEFVFPEDEVYVTPNEIENYAGEKILNGWIINYINTTTYTSQHVVYGSETVELPSGGEGTIEWIQRRTRNAPCEGSLAEPAETCADIVEITAVPEGYVAVPRFVEALENTTHKILIVPILLG